jgi:hypothetical protein
MTMTGMGLKGSAYFWVFLSCTSWHFLPVLSFLPILSFPGGDAREDGATVCFHLLCCVSSEVHVGLGRARFFFRAKACVEGEGGEGRKEGGKVEGGERWERGSSTAVAHGRKG